MWNRRKVKQGRKCEKVNEGNKINQTIKNVEHVQCKQGKTKVNACKNVKNTWKIVNKCKQLKRSFCSKNRLGENGSLFKVNGGRGP